MNGAWCPGAGVLPVSADGAWALLGLDWTDEFADFGGRIDPGECAWRCAARELCEETLGAFRLADAAPDERDDDLAPPADPVWGAFRKPPGPSVEAAVVAEIDRRLAGRPDCAPVVFSRGDVTAIVEADGKYTCFVLRVPPSPPSSSGAEGGDGGGAP